MKTEFVDILKPNYLVKVKLKGGTVVGAKVLDKHYSQDKETWLIELGVKTDTVDFRQEFTIDDILESVNQKFPLRMTN